MAESELTHLDCELMRACATALCLLSTLTARSAAADERAHHLLTLGFGGALWNAVHDFQPVSPYPNQPFGRVNALGYAISIGYRYGAARVGAWDLLVGGELLGSYHESSTQFEVPVNGGSRGSVTGELVAKAGIVSASGRLQFAHGPVRPTFGAGGGWAMAVLTRSIQTAFEDELVRLNAPGFWIGAGADIVPGASGSGFGCRVEAEVILANFGAPGPIAPDVYALHGPVFLLHADFLLRVGGDGDHPRHLHRRKPPPRPDELLDRVLAAPSLREFVEPAGRIGDHPDRHLTCRSRLHQTKRPSKFLTGTSARRRRPDSIEPGSRDPTARLCK